MTKCKTVSIYSTNEQLHTNEVISKYKQTLSRMTKFFNAEETIWLFFSKFHFLLRYSRPAEHQENFERYS